MELIKQSKTRFIPIGLAIFSMFFGAGNSIFPLLVGIQSGSKNFWGVFGLSFTAILIPMLGLFGMVLYAGDYKSFFYRLGKVPGFFLISLIMIVIGPFAGIPRCITLAFGTLKPHLGMTPLVVFSSCVCVLAFFKTVKKSKLLDILGKFLTPVLLLTLAIIIFKGIFEPKAMGSIQQTTSQVFLNGLLTGYQMMDLLAAFFFATTIISCMKMQGDAQGIGVRVLSQSLIYPAILLAASLLGIIYIGFSYVGAFQSAHFQGVSQGSLLGAVGIHVLGKEMGILMGVAFALACLTTIITLVSVFSDFIYKECFYEKIPYPVCILITLIAAFFCSNLGFEGICRLISPLLNICYPALICLTVCNILHKLYGIKWVKLPVLLVFVSSLGFYFVH